MAIQQSHGTILRMRLLCSLAIGVGLLAAPTAANATTYYVNQSTAGPGGDGGPCTSKAAPCLHINAAVVKAQTSPGNDVRILADPNGFTDTYPEHVVLSGANPITLRGAGTAATQVTAVPTLYLVELQNASTISDLRITGGDSAALIVSSGGVAERVVAEGGAGTGGVSFAATIRDSVLRGATAAQISSNGTVVRSRLEATATGVAPFNALISGSVLDSVVSGPTSTGTVGISMPATGPSMVPTTLTLRHVTLLGFEKRAVVAAKGTGTENTLQAVNTTLAGPAGTQDLIVGAGGGTSDGKASLINVNRSAARTQILAGGTVESVGGLDVAPGVTADGHLAAGSALIDRGTSTGFLAGNPNDTLDLGRGPRLIGPAPDIGAYEYRPPPANPPAPDTTAPVLTKVKLPKSFRSKCPRRPRGCKPGFTLRITLSEAATVELAFKKVVRRGKRSKTLRAKLKGKAGPNKLRFKGKIKRKPLAKGRYKLTITAIDAAGNRSLAIKKTVRVK